MHASSTLAISTALLVFHTTLDRFLGSDSIIFSLVLILNFKQNQIMVRRYRYHKDRYRYDTYDFQDNNNPGFFSAILFGTLIVLFAPVIFTATSFFLDIIFNPEAIIDSVPKNLRELPESLAILPNKMPRIVSLEIEAEKNLCHVIVSKEAKPLLVKENQNSILLPEQEEPPDKLLTYDPTKLKR